MFKKGKSGNPLGRKRGAIDRRVAWRRELAEHLPQIVGKVVELARAGDLDAARLIFARTMPVLRARGEPVELPGLKTAATPSEQVRVILDALASGSLSTDSASELLAAIANATNVIAAGELAERVAALERDAAKGGDRASD